MKKHIHFYFLYKPFFFPNRLQLQKFLLQLFTKEGYKIDTINYIFCNDVQLLALNETYLHHVDYTDILTFELSKKGDPLIADIYISIERVKENSQLFHSTFQKELYRVIFHGALHLCAYTDKTQKDKKHIRLKEDYYLTRYFRVSKS